MKQLVCEMCGGTELIKDGGVFVCQTCGCKYSVEEAKRMMIEGTVDVQGTVKVDNSDFVQKYLANARRARKKEDWEETEKYYNMVEQNDPHNIEAIFYSSYGKAKYSLYDSNLYKRQAAFKALQNCVSIIDDNFSIENEEENKQILEEISQDIIKMACSQYVYNQRKNGYGLVVSSDRDETITLFNELGREFCLTCEHIAKIYPDEEKEKRLFYYNLALKNADFILKNGNLPKFTVRKWWQDVCATYLKWIKECEQKSKDDYWEAHVDEKLALEAEKQKLEALIKEYEIELDNVPGMSDFKYLTEQKNGFETEKQNLSLIKIKERVQLDRLIEECKVKILDLSNSMENDIVAINKKINDAKSRIKEIDSYFIA
ncbi:MAG: hypothetical protein E7242_04270 [Lachnospiraceae bacterium]|nr:hypothetical protein [Lachnospiraceae bacterium]